MAGKNLPKKMPAKASYVYDLGTGEKAPDSTRIIKANGKDLRARPGQNNGR